MVKSLVKSYRFEKLKHTTMKYLVTLKLHLGEYEKSNQHIVDAKSSIDAGVIALKNECHNTPDFPNKETAWDGVDLVYKVRSVIGLTDLEYEILSKLKERALLTVLSRGEKVKVVTAFGEQLTKSIANGDDPESDDGGQFVTREFETKAEAQAYMLALSDMDGYWESYVLTGDEIEKYSNEISR